MKFNFRKIASALASTAMVGSTVALAAAASYPAPFVDNGAADVAVVYGSTLDMSAVSDITTSLNSALNSQSSGNTGVGSDSVQLAKDPSNLFNLGDDMNDVYPSIDEGELGNVLADGVYKNDDNDDFDYEQDIVMAGETFVHFLDSDFNDDMPALGFEYSDGDEILTYTLDFKPDAAEGGVAWADFVGTTIDIMGNEYYILDASNASGGSLDLLNSANSVVLNEGATINVGGFSVSLSFIDSDHVKLVVDGETTPALEEDDTYQLDSGDYVGIQEILAQDYEGGAKQVEFSIGSGKIELINGSEVKLNGDEISDDTDYVLEAEFTQSGTGNVDMDDFTLTWSTDEDIFLGVGTDSTEMTMPGFGGIKVVLGDFNTPAEEVTTIEANGDDSFQIKTTLTDGPITLDILYLNSTVNGWAGLGEDDEHVLVTNGTENPKLILTESEDSYFVATWYSGDDHESYAFELSSITDNDGDNSTKLKNLAGGSDIVLSEVTDTETVGEITFTLLTANDDDGNATIHLTGGDIYADRIVSEEGLWMWLPLNGSGHTGQNVNMTIGWNLNWTMNFTEEDEDGEVEAGNDITSTISIDFEDGAESGAPSGAGTGLEAEDDSDVDVYYVVSPLASVFRHDAPTGSDSLSTLEVTYHGGETSVDVFVSSSDTSGDDSTSLGDVSVLDTELAASGLSGNNLIVVGGSCVNSVASDLLLGAGCGDSWTAATGLGEGDYLVETFSQTNGKVATLVAGWSQEDTASAATFLANSADVSTDADSRYVNGALA